MRFGLALPHYEFSIPSERKGPSWKSVKEVATWAEGAGFSSVWVSDHVHLDLEKYGGSPEPQKTFEFTTLCGALSQVTSRVEIGVLVACAVLRPPALLARSAETLASLSGRTFWLGLGAGWYPPDFEAAGVDFGTPSGRLARLEETARLVGRYLEPDSRVRRIVGGKGGPKVLSVTARAADGWNVSWAIDPDTLAAKVSHLKKLWAVEGRGPEPPYVSVGLTCLVAPTRAELRRRFFQMFEDFGLSLPPDPEGAFDAARSQRLVCTTGELAGRIEAYERAGATEIVCGFGPVPFAMWDREVAEEFVEAAGISSRLA